MIVITMGRSSIDLYSNDIGLPSWRLPASPPLNLHTSLLVSEREGEVGVRRCYYGHPGAYKAQYIF